MNLRDFSQLAMGFTNRLESRIKAVRMMIGYSHNAAMLESALVSAVALP